MVVQARVPAEEVREVPSCGWLAAGARCAGQRREEAHRTGVRRCCRRRPWPSLAGEAEVAGLVRLVQGGFAVAAASSSARTYRHRQWAAAQHIWGAGGKARVEVREVVEALRVSVRVWRHTGEEQEEAAAVHHPVWQLLRRH